MAGIIFGVASFVHVISRPVGWEHYRSIPWVTYVHPNKRKLEKAKALVKAGKLSEARDVIIAALTSAPRSPFTRQLRDLLGELNTRIFFSAEPSPRKTEYLVRRGDALSTIARKLKSNADVIMRINNLGSTTIRVGEMLSVPRLDFTISIDMPRERVVVHDGYGFFTQYPIIAADLPPVRIPTIQTRVRAKTFSMNGEPAASGQNGGEESIPRIYLSDRDLVLYGVDEGGETTDPEIAVAQSKPAGGQQSGEERDRPPRGIAMLKEDIRELEVLIRKGTPVTIVLNRQ
ncbi:MAG TPA: LysM peptidoglycan-binding domain-containing protein [Chthoniobacterales bacterium]